MAAAGQLAGWQRPPVPEVQKIVDVVGTEMHAVISGQATPEDAVKKSQELIDREMRKAGYY
jgi:ABC-type glycerol-3-phosphate transport system substrate-binding protein